ncbi:2111_t:CDS:1, partial [Gigaspora rosea]
MYLRCNVPVEGTKTELVNHLESYWKELENEYEPQGPLKGKSVEQPRTESYEKRDRRPMQEGIDGQNYAFMSYMEDRLEEKIEEKL